MTSSARVAVVTGAGSGIGRAAALALLHDGFRVVLAGRRRDPLAETATASGAAGRALVVPTDVTRPDSVRALFAETKRVCGRLDVLFNNAGMDAPGALEEFTYEQWRQVLDVNVTAVFLCTQEAFKLMKSQEPRGGRIINNGSLSAHAPRPDSAVYTASKHAVTGLTRATALDGRKYDIACCQIDIGNAGTEFAARMGKGVLQADGTVKVEPLMDVAHVGRAVAHIAGLPLDVNVLFTTLMATKMPFVGRG